MVSQNEHTIDRLFWKCQYRKGRTNETKCPFFEWADLRGMTTSDRPISLEQSRCRHSEVNKSGTNFFRRKVRCNICGLLLVDELVNQDVLEEKKIEEENQMNRPRPSQKMAPPFNAFRRHAPSQSSNHRGEY